VGLCERGNELPNFIKCGEFVDSEERIDFQGGQLHIIVVWLVSQLVS
jgi:hypothetical protein